MRGHTRLRVALALGSGGARGYAHIGVIQVLEEHGFDIVSVAGSSMGAVVGGLYAAERLDAYVDWVSGLSQFDVLRLFDFSLSAPGAVKAEKIFVRMRELVGEALIEDLPIPFTAVATDLLARKAVWFQQGPLEVALRASIAIPGIFTPVMLNGRLLVDGGVLESVPIASAVSSEAHATVAVDLNGEPADSSAGTPVVETTSSSADSWLDRLRSRAARSPERDKAPAVNPAAILPPGLTKLEVMNLSLEAMHSVLKTHSLAANPPDLLITVPKDTCRSLDFHRAPQLIEIGRAAATDALARAGLTTTSSESPLAGAAG